MSESVEFQKQVFNKKQYEKIVDTSFKQLGVQSPQEQLEETPTVSDFFQMYDELFYDIPEIGATNSHEYLIKQSSEYINFEQDNEEISALQNEIAQLRTELLDTQRQLIEAQTGVPLEGEATEIQNLQNQLESLQTTTQVNNL